MSHQDVSHSKEPIRLFKSDFLEFFTHIHPAVVLAIWAPVALFFLVRAIVTRPAGISFLLIPALVLAGVFLWTLAEYTLHRFVFHFRPRTPWQERAVFLMHGVHHAQPMLKTRLVMPPAVSIPLALVFYGLFYLILGVLLRAPYTVAPLFSGFISGYLLYDMTHYSLHHLRSEFRYFKFIRQWHMQHHARIPVRQFGVSSPVWDYAFRTVHPGLQRGE